MNFHLLSNIFFPTRTILYIFQLDYTMLIRNIKRFGIKSII